MATVADVLVDTLVSAGVERIYGIVGDSLNGITNSINNKKTLEWIHTRHEEAAAFAAGAEAQLTGKLTVCAGSCGPGNMHLINGLYDSHRSGAPVLAIAAHIPTAEIGGDYFQETHPNIFFKECSHFCEVVNSPEQMPRLLHIAMQTAISKKGVAVLVLSGDMALKAATEAASALPVIYQTEPVITPNQTELEKVAGLLNEGKKITVFCGNGCKNAHAELMQLCQKIKAPMVHALRAKEWVEFNNPYDVGMTGFIGFPSGYYAMEACDTLLLLGTSFPYRQFYPSKARVIQVDIRGEQLGKRTPVEVGVVGDVKATLSALLPLLKEKNEGAHLEQAVNHYKKSRLELDELATATKTNLIHPQYVAKMIDEIASEDAIIACDVGTPTVWAARYLKMNGKRRLLGSFNHGSMANAFSQGLGAQATFKNRQVISMCGDGGFSMLMGDVLTLVQQKLPVKVVIFNNGTLGFVELEMLASGMIPFGTDLVNPNFANMAKALGIAGVRIEQASDVQDGLMSAFAEKGPAIVDIVVNRNELVMPPTITAEQMKGFSLFMIKAILSGKGNEVYDLAKTNLWR